MGDARCALLVDTGWQGRSQNLLTRAFPEIDWWGAYFGRSGTPSSDRTNWHKMIGIAFESDQFDPARPQTCVVLNRHLIENLFEPAGRSIEWLAEPEAGVVVAPDADSVLADAPTRESDPIFSGVLSHLETLQDGNKPSLLRRHAAEAWSRIARMTLHPAPGDLALFDAVERSADFGRDLKVPMLLPKEVRFDGDTPDLRIRDALWPCGQAAVEYPDEIAKPLQKKLAGVPRTALPEKRREGARATRPRVAVITRTMDRPMFLKRALDSVARQTYRDFIHVVVNDGGDNEPVKAAIEGANIDHARVRLVDALVNRGMEAASNLAIRNSDSDYIVIHDDDDTWEPAFLEKTVAFLDGAQGAHYGGVITHSTYCSEEVTPDGVVVHASTPYNDWIENVHLMEMAIENFFPPIAFLFRRELWERLEGFNEQYPVLGDWDFNLRFLVEADIAVINEPLANYHHRDRGDVTTFGNSVIAGRGKHLEYAAVVRNNFVRSMVKRGHAAAATLAGMGIYLADQRTTVRASNQRVAQIAKDTSSVAAQLRSIDSSRAWGDSYWFALQTLLKALAENDTAKLDELVALSSGSAGSAAARVMSLVRQTRSAKSLTPVSPANLERATARLLKDAVVRQQATFADMPIPPDFDETAYLRQNLDVAQRVKEGALSSGYEHYLRYGRSEGRHRPLR
ncbi:MAG: glycosyltransferase [Micropepsaceae bacterium]